MKWYNSVKIKVVGFFLFIAVLFLLSIILVFSSIYNNNLHENALRSANSKSSEILIYIKDRQLRAEEIVKTMASVAEVKYKNKRDYEGVLPAILSADRDKTINIVSGGIWFEPDIVCNNNAKKFFFYNKNKDNRFERVIDYVDFREMDFYRGGKQTDKEDVYWTNVYVDPVTKTKMITVVHPLYDKKRFIGVASLDLKIEESKNELWSLIDKNGFYMMILDRNCQFIASSSMVKKYTQEMSIFDVKNRDFHEVVKTIEQSLYKEDPKALHIHKNIKSTIYFIENDPILKSKSIVSVYHFPDTHWNIIISLPENKVMERANQIFYKVLWVVALMTLFAAFIGYFVLKKVFVGPIESINEQLEDVLEEDGLHYKLLKTEDKGEIGALVHNLNYRTQALEETQEREAEEIKKRLQNEKMLVQQSKMAAMGDMMDAVAHQWKQPLNALSMYSEIIRSDVKEGNVDEAYIEQFREDMQVQIDHMVNTLDEFRTFFRPNKYNQQFRLIDVIESVLFLTKDDLLKNAIIVDIEQKDPIEILGSENEFKHLILNIITNAKDAFNENSIKKRKIRIRLIQDPEGDRIEIEDNAGGIPEEVINDIFKANVTTKVEGKVTGIGLYMSMQIAVKHHAVLSVKNMNEGACFIITFQKCSL